MTNLTIQTTRSDLQHVRNTSSYFPCELIGLKILRAEFWEFVNKYRYQYSIMKIFIIQIL